MAHLVASVWNLCNAPDLQAISVGERIHLILGAWRKTPFSLWLIVFDHFYARFAETPKLGEAPQTVGVSQRSASLRNVFKNDQSRFHGSFSTGS